MAARPWEGFRGKRLLLSIVLALCCHPGVLFGQAVAASTVVQIENAKPGTSDWQLKAHVTNGDPEIEGYASAASVNRGEQISFFVNTSEHGFTIEIFRVGWYGGAGGRRMTVPVVLPGTKQAIPAPDPLTGLIECQWTNPYVLTVPRNPTDPTDWASGAYLARLTAGTSRKQAYIPFTVRDDGRPSDYLLQSSVATFEAYNPWGGKSLYPFNSTGAQANHVSFNRPYRSDFFGGAGQFMQWEIQMIRWLEREGYDVTYSTDVDSHANGESLLSHKAVLVAGHDEYWSWQMRTNIEAALKSGVSLGFFSANTCYWQIRFEPSAITGAPNRTIVAYKESALKEDPLALDGDPANDQFITTKWRNPPVNRPEDALIGVMSSTDVNVASDITVSNSSIWICSKTGLQDGDRLPGILGYEVDRLSGHSPPNTVLLAHSPYSYANRTDYSDTVYYITPDGKAMVFAAGTIEWSWGLDSYQINQSRVNPAVQQITRNILARLISPYGPYLNAVQFSSSMFNAGEGAGSATITVTRTGDVSGGAEIDYTTSDGTASQSSKYIAASGTLVFGPGETSKSFQVLLVDEAFVEGNKTVNLTLSNPRNTTLGPAATAVLTIIDNDSTNGPGNPLDSGNFFARQQYLDFLNRLPESKGLNDWSNYLSACSATDLQCQVDRRIAASSGFFRSPEFFSTGYFVIRMYRATLYPDPAGEVPPHPSFEEFIRDATSVHYGVAGDMLASSKLAFAQSWVHRTDFQLMYGGDTTTSAFIDHLAQVAGVTLSQADRTSLLGLTRAEIVIQIVDNPQVDAREYNAAFVTMQYMGYLRRIPEKSGFLAWLAYLNANPGNCAIMINGFAFSREYRERFGLYGDPSKFPTASTTATQCAH